MFIKQDTILIPRGTFFNKIFSDPCPNIVKIITIYSNGRCIKYINECDTHQDIVCDLTVSSIYIYCAKKIYKYMEDYIISINNILKATVIHTINKHIDIMNKNNIIIFIQPPSYILYKKNTNIHNNLFVLNTEQVTLRSGLIFDWKHIRTKFNIIDYSRENIDIMNKNDVKNIIYFPYIYNKKEIYDLEKTEDICGISIFNTRRRILIYNNLLANNKIKNIIGGKNNEI